VIPDGFNGKNILTDAYFRVGWGWSGDLAVAVCGMSEFFTISAGRAPVSSGIGLNPAF
tara:strand:- start:444 stop:617 length:174 start_codon:yes stop_codon:yes gene_type:complete